MTNVLSSVNERRLRPVYEQLDNGNNKNALHEAEKVLKKNKDLTAAKVLKVIALQRMGRDQDAYNVSKEVVAVSPVDENSLQGMSLYYKDISKPELISPLYEAAVKQCPNNEEFLTHLFMSYVRQENFPKMQKVALSLYKQFPKNPYLFWGIMSIVLQAQFCDDETMANGMFLKLAEKMIEKHVNNSNIEAEAEVRLYLLVLTLLKKHDKAMEVITGDLGKKLSPELEGMPSKYLATLELQNKWDIVNVEYIRLLRASPDIWNYSLGYLDSLFHLINEKYEPKTYENGNENSLDHPHYSLEQAAEFITELVDAENKKGKFKRRGPYLLRLQFLQEVDKKLKENIKSFGELKELLLEYSSDFSNKPCCFSDLQKYFDLLKEEEIEAFLDELMKQSALFTCAEELNGECDEELKIEFNRKKEKEIQRHIFTLKVSRHLGEQEKLSVQEKLNLVQDCSECHKNGVSYSKDRPSTDIRTVDYYAIAAAHLLLDLFNSTNDFSSIWRAIFILKDALQQSQYNYEIKFMLIQLYCKLGAFLPCVDIYDSMEIKHVQQDTLGYTVCRHVTALGFFPLASQVFQLSRTYYINNNKESNECLISCFRNGTFSKVHEFIEYRRLVNKSFHAILTRTEHVVMDIFTQGKIDQPITTLLRTVDHNSVDYDKLVDTRDFKLISDINSPNKRITPDLTAENFECEKTWLKFRKLLLNCLHSVLSSLEISQNETDVQNGTENNGKVYTALDGFISELEVLSDKLHANALTESSLFLPHHPIPSRIPLCKEAKYLNTVLLLMKYSNCLLKMKEPNGEIQDEVCLQENLRKITENIKEFLSTCNEGFISTLKYESEIEEILSETNSNFLPLSCPIPEAFLQLRHSIIERLVLTTEIYSITVLIVTSLQKAVNEIKINVQRKRRKKKGKQNNAASLTWITSYKESLHEFLELGERMKKAIDNIESDVETIGLEVKKLDLNNDVTNAEKDSNDEKLFSEIKNSICESYKVSCTQIKAVVDGRIKNIKELKL